MCKQKLRHFNAFFVTKKLPVRYCTGRKAYVTKKSNVPYGSATLKGCTAPADLCTSKYVDGAGIEPTSLHCAHSVMFHPRILPAQIKKDVLFSRTITSYHDTTLNKDTASITG